MQRLRSLAESRPGAIRFCHMSGLTGANVKAGMEMLTRAMMERAIECVTIDNAATIRRAKRSCAPHPKGLSVIGSLAAFERRVMTTMLTCTRTRPPSHDVLVECESVMRGEKNFDTGHASLTPHTRPDKSDPHLLTMRVRVGINGETKSTSITPTRHGPRRHPQPPCPPVHT